VTADAALSHGRTNRAGLVTATLLVIVAGLAWWQTVAHALGMCRMVDGLAQAGRVMPFDAGPAHFAAMWTMMLAAMMLPGIIPAAAAAQRGHRHPLAGVAVATGYFAVWATTAVIAFGALIALNRVDHPTAWLDRAGGAIVALAGVYQFTGWKRRSMVGDSTPSQTFGLGLSHGLRCLGASWALMAVLLVVGVMNIAWMAAIGAICLGEKTLTRRDILATAVGVALIGIGLVVVIWPDALKVIDAR
jgi:predicted metal-binding membrane protein